MATADGVGHDTAMPAGYPAAWEFDGLLRNGEAVVVRPIRPADAPALVGLRGAASPGTHQHVLLAGPALSLQTAARFSEVDYDARMAFVALVSDELVGLASYDRPDARAPAAEASFVVAGARQGHGVTTLLFESLAEYARTRGILRFTAEVRAQNTALLELLAATGLRCTRRNGPATVHVEIDLRPTPAYRASCDQPGGDGGGRQRRGDPAAALDRGRGSGTAPGQRRASGGPVPARRRLLRHRLPGEPGRPGGLRRARVPGAVVGSRAGRPGHRRRSRISRPRRDRRGRLGWRARRHHHYRGLRRDGPLGRRGGDRDAERGPQARDADRRPELPGRGKHRSGSPA